MGKPERFELVAAANASYLSPKTIKNSGFNFFVFDRYFNVFMKLKIISVLLEICFSLITNNL